MGTNCRVPLKSSRQHFRLQASPQWIVGPVSTHKCWLASEEGAGQARHRENHLTHPMRGGEEEEEEGEEREPQLSVVDGQWRGGAHPEGRRAADSTNCSTDDMAGG